MTGSTEKSVNWRIAALDTIASVLPMERRDELAELLTDQNIVAHCCDARRGFLRWVGW